jgi:hypothetical protein
MQNTSDYKQFCKNWLDAWTGNNPAKLLEFYTEDAIYSDPANPTGLKGKAQISIYFSKLLSRNPDWRWEAVEIMPTEKGFTLKWKASIPAKAQKIILYGLDIVELSEHQISRNEVYFDRTPWLEAMK